MSNNGASVCVSSTAPNPPQSTTPDTCQESVRVRANQEAGAGSGDEPLPISLQGLGTNPLTTTERKDFNEGRTKLQLSELKPYWLRDTSTGGPKGERHSRLPG